MIWRRCPQVIRLVSNLSKHTNYSEKKTGIRFIEARSKKAHLALQIFSHNMASTSSDAENTPQKYQNKLAFEKSPYLLQHATNPVEWYPWGNEAIEKAKREDKLIFLSVGYSTCHWCHVMEKESFEKPEIAAIMNKHFINIKVDREERPDIDKVYMTFIQSLTGHGGWPMSVFLSPNLAPIYGGTYFPPTDKYGQPGFKRVLEALANQWHERKDHLVTSGAAYLKALKEASEPTREDADDVPSSKSAETCVKQLIRSYEPKFGGFSDAPKFPQPVNFNILFLIYAKDPKSETGKKCLEMCLHTLTKMAKGGIHDHVGQGFARYSVDAKWHVPHFEKMLYDQSQLLVSYVDAYLSTKDLFYAEIADDIVTYLTRDMQHKEGGFYSAEDADSKPSHNDTEKKEGAFYVWKHDEITSLLNATIQNHDNLKLSDIFCYHFDVKPDGNVSPRQDPHGELLSQNVLINYGSFEETAENFNLTTDEVKTHLQEALKILFVERSKRPRPHLDDKIITAWNGLAISGLSRAAAALDKPEYAAHAEAAANFIKNYLFDKNAKKLLRSCYRDSSNKITQPSNPIEGFQVDYAFVIRGLLDLYESTFNTEWLQFAEQLQDIQDSLFWSEEKGLYYSTTASDETVIVRHTDEQDGAEPSGNSVACGNLIRLSSYLSCSDYMHKAKEILRSKHDILTAMPVVNPELVCALINYNDSPTQIYIAGNKNSSDTKEMIKIVRSQLLPGKIIMLVEGDDVDNILHKKNEVISKMKSVNGRATVYICQHRMCSLPISNAADLLTQFDKRKEESGA
ncbi:spermatogenesis-associated protein 20 isoform X1 [Trichogramma pretiosum]|uniref:spermatogenesis-associated protein 20 isoform X1 n=1 Tax=Trichogramma pretiosum TaxID=7493 RepID=UPI0006C9B846|nr:spermatogenesis-associated protein 20 isoform X1 [Trichogramma pretiosum]